MKQPLPSTQHHSARPELPPLPDLLERVQNLEQLVQLLTDLRRDADAYNPIPPYK